MNVNIYIRLIDYKMNALTSTGGSDPQIAPALDTINTANPQFLKILSCSSDISQTLSIGAQSTGAGAGKILFNPLSISRSMDALSPTLLQSAASGTPFKTVEVFFVSPPNFIQIKHTYKLVAVKSVAWAVSEQTEGAELVSFEYGGLFITVNQQLPDGRAGTPLQFGWNRVKNVRDTDINSIIQ